MPGAIILNEDWSEYDKRKLAVSQDISLFNCNEKWEVQYLIKMLHQRFENLVSDFTLSKAIISSCKETGHPVSRQEFVDLVMLKLMT